MARKSAQSREGSNVSAVFAGIPQSLHTAIREAGRQYAALDGAEEKVRRGGLLERIGLRRLARAGDRLSVAAGTGLSLERFITVLRREGCEIGEVRRSSDDDMAQLGFTYPQDHGYCVATLTDPVGGGAFSRCCLDAKFTIALGPEHLNHLNMHSKFLKFYDLGDGTLILEYSFIVLNVPDDAIALALDMFHGSVLYILRHRFVYGSPTASAGSEPAPAEPYSAEGEAQRRADLSPSDLGGIERRLDRIAQTLDRGPGNDVKAMINRLEDIRSLLRDISGKLDRR